MLAATLARLDGVVVARYTPGMSEPMNDACRQVRWSPRVPKGTLRRLYEFAAQGIWDDELIEDVGLTLYLRCRDILIIHRAQTERLITCPTCLREGCETLVPGTGRRDVPMVCPACGWSMLWHDYRRTFRREQLNPGGAVQFFRAYLAEYDRARSAKARMAAIDRVIHQFHYSLKSDPTRPTRPAGVNLIVGKLEEVVTFLDALSGLDLPQEMALTHAEWRDSFGRTYWPEVLANR
jgi:hypothetical protein